MSTDDIRRRLEWNTTITPTEREKVTALVWESCPDAPLILDALGLRGAS